MQEDSQQPEWMDLLQPIADYHYHINFKYDDGDQDYDWSQTSNIYSFDYSLKWLAYRTDQEENNTLDLPNDDLSSPNEDQDLPLPSLLTYF